MSAHLQARLHRRHVGLVGHGAEGRHLARVAQVRQQQQQQAVHARQAGHALQHAYLQVPGRAAAAGGSE